MVSTSRRKLNQWYQHIILATILNQIQLNIANPVFSYNHPSVSNFQTGRNIRHLPCIVRRSGMEGVCMFAIDCIKANGTHLGTCIDRFYFGSCCQLKNEAASVEHDIVENSIDQNTISHFSYGSSPSLATHSSTASALSSSSLPTVSSSSSAKTEPSTIQLFQTSTHRPMHKIPPSYNPIITSSTNQVLTSVAPTTAKNVSFSVISSSSSSSSSNNSSINNKFGSTNSSNNVNTSPVNKKTSKLPSTTPSYVPITSLLHTESKTESSSEQFNLDNFVTFTTTRDNYITRLPTTTEYIKLQTFQSVQEATTIPSFNTVDTTTYLPTVTTTRKPSKRTTIAKRPSSPKYPVRGTSRPATIYKLTTLAATPVDSLKQPARTTLPPPEPVATTYKRPINTLVTRPVLKTTTTRKPIPTVQPAGQRRTTTIRVTEKPTDKITTFNRRTSTTRVTLATETPSLATKSHLTSIKTSSFETKAPSFATKAPISTTKLPLPIKPSSATRPPLVTTSSFVTRGPITSSSIIFQTTAHKEVNIKPETPEADSQLITTYIDTTKAPRPNPKPTKHIVKVPATDLSYLSQNDVTHAPAPTISSSSTSHFSSTDTKQPISLASILTKTTSNPRTTTPTPLPITTSVESRPLLTQKPSSSSSSSLPPLQSSSFPVTRPKPIVTTTTSTTTEKPGLVTWTNIDDNSLNSEEVTKKPLEVTDWILIPSLEPSSSPTMMPLSSITHTASSPVSSTLLSLPSSSSSLPSSSPPSVSEISSVSPFSHSATSSLSTESKFSSSLPPLLTSILSSSLSTLSTSLQPSTSSPYSSSQSSSLLSSLPLSTLTTSSSLPLPSLTSSEVSSSSSKPLSSSSGSTSASFLPSSNLPGDQTINSIQTVSSQLTFPSRPYTKPAFDYPGTTTIPTTKRPFPSSSITFFKQTERPTINPLEKFTTFSSNMETKKPPSIITFRPQPITTTASRITTTEPAIETTTKRFITLSLPTTTTDSQYDSISTEEFFETTNEIDQTTSAAENKVTSASSESFDMTTFSKLNISSLFPSTTFSTSTLHTTVPSSSLMTLLQSSPVPVPTTSTEADVTVHWTTIKPEIVVQKNVTSKVPLITPPPRTTTAAPLPLSSSSTSSLGITTWSSSSASIPSTTLTLPKEPLVPPSTPGIVETTTQSPATESLEPMTTESGEGFTTETFSSTTSISQMLEGMDYRQVCGKRMFPEPRIVGGAKASFGRWPWQISLRQWRTSTYLHKCGAALLNENWAITAAHCVDNVPPSDLLLRLGEYDLAEEEEPYGYQERRVQIVASHPQFDPRTFEYDLALLRFYEPVVFQPNIIPVCVPETDENFIGRTAYVTGWGRLYEDGPLPSVLQEVSVPVINNTICENMYRNAGYIEHIPHIFICAGWRKGGYDSCEGDSGGPMVIQREDKRFLLAGVISWGIGCAEPNQPGVYTRISEFRDWINQILQF